MLHTYTYPVIKMNQGLYEKVYWQYVVQIRHLNLATTKQKKKESIIYRFIIAYTSMA